MATTQCGCELCKGMASRGIVFTDAPEACAQSDTHEVQIQDFQASRAPRTRQISNAYRNGIPTGPLTPIQSLVSIADWSRARISGGIAASGQSARADVLRHLS